MVVNISATDRARRQGMPGFSGSEIFSKDVPRQQNRRPVRCQARGAALLVVIFMMFVVSSLVVIALETATTDMSITRNTLALSKALYIADAGIQHALANLRADRTWREGFPIPGVEFPPGSGSHYVVSVVDGVGGEVIVTSTGTVDGLSKTVRATISVSP